MNLEGKVIILTGHTGGIGSVVYNYLTKLGATVIGASKSTGFDITNPYQIEKFVKNTIDNHKKIDAYINCIGIYGPIGPMEDNNIFEWNGTLVTNFAGPVWLTRLIIPIMKNQGNGKIIFMGGGGFEPLPNFSAYTSSKFALIKYAETIAAELKDFNIQVNVISPGLVDTKLQNKVLEAKETAGKMYEKMKEVREKSSGSLPDYTAELIVYLLGNKITGKVISAAHDEYEFWKEDYINNSDWYTVKRIDKYTIQSLIRYEL